MFSYQIDENLKLILSQQHQAEEITKVVRENLEQLKTWMPWAKDDYSIDSAREFIKFNLTEFARNGSFSASIILEGSFVGGVGFHNLDLRNKSAHIGYWLAKEAQGKGIMTRCCRVLFNYLFDDFGLNRIQINCNIENTKSRAVPERFGFKLEGIHRQVEWLNEEFRDWAIYAMLAEEWSELKMDN
jgi:ribosomal-protein-serine acetyltransferase